MFNSTVLDVAVGLVFAFLAVSLAVSASVEAVASTLNWRSANLLQGLKSLLNDAEFKGLARQIYNHALINPLAPGTAETEVDLKKTPAYIDPIQFADALIDITKMTQDSLDKIRSAINTTVTDKQLNSLLNGIVDRTAGDLGKIRNQIAVWFDNSMDRLSGAYKRQTQYWSFAIAVVIVVVCNMSAIAIARALWQQPLLAHSFAPSAGTNLAEALKQIRQAQLPVGWTYDRFHALGSWLGLEMLAGWLITALATLFGAPFWFDALQQFVRLKGSGPSPQEKQNKTGAAA